MVSGSEGWARHSYHDGVSTRNANIDYTLSLPCLGRVNPAGGQTIIPTDRSFWGRSFVNTSGVRVHGVLCCAYETELRRCGQRRAAIENVLGPLS